MSRYDLTDFEWRVIAPLLPNKPRGMPRVDDRRVLNGIFWVLRSSAPWRDLPERYGPRTTCYNRFALWRKAGVWSFRDTNIESQDTNINSPAASKLGGGRHGLGRGRTPRHQVVGPPCSDHGNAGGVQVSVPERADPGRSR